VWVLQDLLTGRKIAEEGNGQKKTSKKRIGQADSKCSNAGDADNKQNRYRNESNRVESTEQQSDQWRYGQAGRPGNRLAGLEAGS
jgi:hypothetical protein